MTDDKSLIGNFNPGRSRTQKNSISIIKQQPQSFGIFNASQLGWNTLVNQKQTNIKINEGWMNGAYPGMINPQASLELDPTGNCYTDDDPTEIFDSSLDLDSTNYPFDYRLGYFFVNTYDYAAESLILKYTNIDGHTALVEKFNKIKIDLEYDFNCDPFKIRAFYHNIIASCRILKHDVDDDGKYMVFTSFYIPIAIYSDQLSVFDEHIANNLTPLVWINGRLVEDEYTDNHVYFRHPTEHAIPMDFQEGEDIQSEDLGPMYGKVAKKDDIYYNAKNIYSRGVALKKSWAQNEHIAFEYDVEIITPPAIDNNKIYDEEADYNASTQFYAQLNLSATGNFTEINSDANNPTVPLYLDTRVSFADNNEDVEETHYKDFEFKYLNNYLKGPVIKNFGITTIWEREDSFTGALDRCFHPYIEIYGTDGNRRYYTFNNDYPDRYTSSYASSSEAITDVKLVRLHVMEESVYKRIFTVEYQFNNEDDFTRKYLYEFKNTNSFTNDLRIRDNDNLWRLYVSEIISDKFGLSEQNYAEDASDDDFPFIMRPEYNLLRNCNLFAGNNQAFGYLQSMNMNFSLGHTFYFPDSNMCDEPFLIVRDDTNFIFKGYSIPILYPTQPIYNNNPGFHYSFPEETYLYQHCYSFYNYDPGNSDIQYAMCHTIHMIPTIKIIAGDVWSTMPATCEEAIGMDPTKDGYYLSEKSLTINNTKYAIINNTLCLASSHYPYNGDLNNSYIRYTGDVYVINNYIFISNTASTQIFYSQRETGISTIGHIDAKVMCQPFKINKTIIIPTADAQGSFKIYIMQENKVVPAFTIQDIACTKVGLISVGNGQYYILIKEFETDQTTDINTLHIVNINSNVNIFYDSSITYELQEPYFSKLDNFGLYTSFSWQNADANNYFRLKYAGINYPELTSHKFFPPARSDSIFIGKYLIIDVYDYLADNTFDIDIYINGTKHVDLDEQLTKNRNVFELPYIPIKDIYYKITGVVEEPGSGGFLWGITFDSGDGDGDDDGGRGTPMASNGIFPIAEGEGGLMALYNPQIYFDIIIKDIQLVGHYVGGNYS